VWAFVVVVVDDVVELAVEFIDAGGRWFVSESDFECLVEALDFALGLWVIEFAVFLGDSDVDEELFEAVS